MKKTILITLLLGFSMSEASAQTNKTFFLGHSLINFHVPNMLNKLSIAGSQTFSYDANIGNGASLGWHWTNPTTGQGDQWDLTLPDGGYENFIFTEAVPLETSLVYGNTYKYADSLCDFADQYNPNIQYYIYETWHCIHSGGVTQPGDDYPCPGDPGSNEDWRARIDTDLPRWETIMDSLDLIHTNPTLMIPGGQGMGLLSDSINVGALPGLSSIEDLFTDHHHLDERGNYFIGCIMYAVIHGISPVGLPNQLTSEFGVLYDVYPTPEQAAKMQEIAWQTVCDYPRDGVDCAPLSLTENTKEESLISVYPVPAKENLSIRYDDLTGTTSYIVYDRVGNVMLHGDLNSKISLVNVADLTSGLYFLKIDNQTIKFVK